MSGLIAVTHDGLLLVVGGRTCASARRRHALLAQFLAARASHSEWKGTET
jgi:hypothetical protein